MGVRMWRGPPIGSSITRWENNEMLPYDLEELTSTDVRGLIDADVAEGLRLEYKRALCIDSSEMRKKFLSRVSGMANAAGGDIVFGISDRKGEDDQNTGIAD